MKKIALLGSTGSIGRQVLSCVERHSDEFKIVSLAANQNAKLLSEQINKFNPKVSALANPEKASEIGNLPNGVSLYVGEHSMLHAITDDCDVVFIAVVGFCGFLPLIQAIRMDKIIALANKESIICGGKIVFEELKKHPKAKIIPVDSEHSAIWQSLGMDATRPFKRIILTASGGAFRDYSYEQLKSVSASDALKHPNWNMGKKITVDCATMMNKGFEVMEAMWLFSAKFENIKVLIHPESIIHSMVEFEDNAVIAQLANPSMEIPIQLALTYPNRLTTGVASYDFTKQPLNFKEVDLKKYPCFSLALDCAKKGNNLPCALSAANEIAVNLFLEEKIAYLDIQKYIERALEKMTVSTVTEESILETDARARQCVWETFKEEQTKC